MATSPKRLNPKTQMSTDATIPKLNPHSLPEHPHSILPPNILKCRIKILKNTQNIPQQAVRNFPRLRPSFPDEKYV